MAKLGLAVEGLCSAESTLSGPDALAPGADEASRKKDEKRYGAPERSNPSNLSSDLSSNFRQII